MYLSDTITEDDKGNMFNLLLLKKIFGPFFYIEPRNIEIKTTFIEYDDFIIGNEIPSYSIYIRINKEMIDKVCNGLSKTKKYNSNIFEIRT